MAKMISTLTIGLEVKSELLDSMKADIDAAIQDARNSAIHEFAQWLDNEYKNGTAPVSAIFFEMDAYEYINEIIQQK